MDKMQENDLVVVVYRDKRYLKKIELDKSFHGKGGILPFSKVIGSPWGSRFGEYDVFAPTIEDIMMFGVRRETQIVFPKDAFFTLCKLNIKPGTNVLEIGTGSGTMTLLLSRAVGAEGSVTSIEKEERHYKNAKKNTDKFQEFANIDLKNTDILYFDGGLFDAAFIDLREPWVYMDKIASLLKGGSVAAFIVPTANQVSETLLALRDSFGGVEVIEILFRTYKTIAARLRPEDRMVGHTGYLLFGRKLDMISKITEADQEEPSQEVTTQREELFSQ